MSHLSDIGLSVQDLNAMQEAASLCGMELVRGQEEYHWYGTFVGDSPMPEGMTLEQLGKCKHALRLKDEEMRKLGYVDTRTDKVIRTAEELADFNDYLVSQSKPPIIRQQGTLSRAEYVKRLHRAMPYEVGLVEMDGELKPFYDYWSSGSLDKFLGKGAKELKKNYHVAEIAAKARKQGHQVKIATLDDGRRQVVVDTGSGGGGLGGGLGGL